MLLLSALAIDGLEVRWLGNLTLLLELLTIIMVIRFLNSIGRPWQSIAFDSALNLLPLARRSSTTPSRILNLIMTSESSNRLQSMVASSSGFFRIVHYLGAFIHNHPWRQSFSNELNYWIDFAGKRICRRRSCLNSAPSWKSCGRMCSQPRWN